MNSVYSFVTVFLLLAGFCSSFAEEFHESNIRIAGKIAVSNSSNREPKLFFQLPWIPISKITVRPNTTVTTTVAPPTTLPIVDQVALMIHNAIRLTHGVPLLAHSPILQNVAQVCADYYATQNMLPAVKPCPTIAMSARPTAAESVYAFDLTMPGAGVGASQKIRAAIWTTWYNEPDPNWVTPVYNTTYENKVQIIWRSTTEVGCAVSRLSTMPPTISQFVVCLYNPPGNTPQTSDAFAANVFQDRL